MLNLRTILHPTDFSGSSRHAYQLAAALARDYGARLVVLHVDDLPTALYGDVLAPPRPEGYLKKVREQLDELGAPGLGIQVDCLLQEGEPVPEILGVAKDTGADLIVMGTHGRGGLARLVMGSVAEKILRQAPCPVVVVKTPAGAAERPVQTAAATPQDLSPAAGG